MAERIPPGFSIPLGFYDGPEVRSIPRRIRTAAVGVFALAGNYSSTRLSDGYVDNETLKDLGCSPVIREALKNTLGRDGEPDPLWVEATNGIRFAKWDDWQRTKAEVTAYKDAEAARKRAARARKKQEAATIATQQLSDSYAVTVPQEPFSSGIANGSETSRPAGTPTCPTGHPVDVRHSETETETENYREDSPAAAMEPEQGAPMREERGSERGRSDPVHHSAARLVSTLIPPNTPNAVKTGLRLAASQLIVGDGLSSEIVAESLRRWAGRPGLGVPMLAHIASDVLREDTAPPPKSKQRDWAELTREAREAEQHQQPSRKAIEK